MKFGEYLRININHLKLEMLRAGSKSLFVKYHKSYFRQINNSHCAPLKLQRISAYKIRLGVIHKLCRLGRGHCVFKWILRGHLKPTPNEKI